MANLSSNTNLTIPRGAVVKFGLGGIGQAIDESGTYKLGNQEVILGPYPVAKTITVLVQSTVRYVIDTDGVIDTVVPVDPITPAIDGSAAQAAVIGAFGTSRTSKYYGFKHDGSDESALMQEALEDLYAISGNHGAQLMMEEGQTTVMQGVIWPPGITIQSESGNAMFTENTGEWTGHRFKLPDVATQPLIKNDTSRGYIRSAQGSYGDGPQRYHGGVLRGIMLSGSRNSDNHTADCDLLFLDRAWNITLDSCSAIDCRGFGIRATDLNVLNMKFCNFLNAPVFFDSVADSHVFAGQFGNGNGLVSSVFWVSGGSGGSGLSWKNLFSRTFIYNNQSNGFVGLVTRQYAFPMVVQTVATSADGSNPNTVLFATNSATGSNAHKWTTGTPVTVSSTGTLPGGLSADVTYFVRVINAGRVAFATTRKRALANQLVTISSAGSGTITVQVGENANMYVNDGATKNSFDGGRFDQAFGAGLLIANAPGNSFGNYTIQESYFGNYVGETLGGAAPCVAPTPDAAVILRNGAINTTLGGSWQVDGSKQGTLGTTTGYESRQKFGLSVDQTSRQGLVVGEGFASFNHTAANSDTGAGNWKQAELSPNREMLGSSRWETVGAGATSATYGNGRYRGWQLAAANANSIIESEWTPKPGWTTVNITIYFVPAAAGAGNVSLLAQISAFAVGETTDTSAFVTTTAAQVAAGGTDVLSSITLPNISLATLFGKQGILRIKREASSPDTFAGAITISHVVIERA